MTLNDINWICAICGEKFGKHHGVSTWHEGKCDYCGKITTVTQPSDFGITVAYGGDGGGNGGGGKVEEC